MKLPSFLQFTQNYHIRGKVSLSLHSPVNLLLCSPSPCSIEDMLTIRKFRKEERTSTWLKDGFSCRHLLQSRDDYHSYCYYEFLFLLVLHLSVISPAFSLQLPYKTSQPPPRCCCMHVSVLSAPQACFTADPAMRNKAEKSRKLVTDTATFYKAPSPCQGL